MGKTLRMCITCFSMIIVVRCESCVKKEFNTLECNYIPSDIPNNISAVKIVDFIRRVNQLNSSLFQSERWGHIQHLELRDESTSTEASTTLQIFAKCFSGLKNLNSLKLHMIDYIDHFDPDAFLGLDTVEVLDLSDCTRVSLKHIIPALRGMNKLPGLQKLLLSNLGKNVYPSAFDSTFSKALKSKNITNLDVSRSQVSVFNFTAVTQDLNRLKVLNLSHSVVSDTFHHGNKVNDLLHIDMLDVSYVMFPKTFGLIGKVIISNYTVKEIDPRGHLDLIFAYKCINATGINPAPNSVWIENCKADIKDPLSWHTKEFKASHNNIKRLDINILCPYNKAFNFEHVDIAYNGMEFIHPSVFTCIPNLSKLDLSGNQLFKMMNENSTLFGNMFKSLAHLRRVSLSRNDLVIVPRNLFENNLELIQIDFSLNKITQIEFNLRQLTKLQTLDLRGNQLQVLDDKSMQTLNSIPTISNGIKSGSIVLLQENPFSCSKCSSKRSIQWLISTAFLNTSLTQLICKNEDGNKQIISSETLNMVQNICNRKTIFVSAGTSIGVLFVYLGIFIFVIYKRKKHAKMKERLDYVLHKFVEGKDQFEFVTFLSYSSEDKDFVEEYVKTHLNENLQIMTGIERDLICTGDEYLRPGFMILDETARCIERASVVIAVVSNSYCGSRYCHNELDQAYRLNKPILLMLKEHVDEERMMPTMRLLFKNNVRILWTVENGEFVLKTTWKNVCESVLGLIVRDV